MYGVKHGLIYICKPHHHVRFPVIPLVTMYTARHKRPYKTKHTTCAKKPSLPEQKEAKLEAERQSALLAAAKWPKPRRPSAPSRPVPPLVEDPRAASAAAPVPSARGAIMYKEQVSAYSITSRECKVLNCRGNVRTSRLKIGPAIKRAFPELR